ncbi:MAG: lamin tail domain-containing protein, partial [Myxococcota bacterium]
GGATSGGAANGGATSGGAASGGAANGGAANGGAANGGAANGGVDGGGGKTAAQGGALGSGGTTQTKCGLVINEIQVGSSVSPADEFVELYNSCAVAQALNGYELVYRAASGTSDVLLHTFSSSDVIAGKGFLLLAGASFAGTSDMSLGGGVNGVLALQAGGLALRTANAVIIDALGYGNATNAFVEGAPALAPTLGTSISRVPDGRDMNDNWQDFSATTSTPRGANH